MLPPLGDLHRIECWLLHHGLHLKGILRPVLPRHGLLYERSALLASATEEFKSGAPARTRTSSFRLRRAACRTLTLRELEKRAPCRCCPGARLAHPPASSIPFLLLGGLECVTRKRREERVAERSLHRGREPQHRRARYYTNDAFQKWWLRPVSRWSLLVFSEALISLSYTAMVPPRGVAPRSLAYRARALLLSYGGIKEWSPDEVTLLGLPDVSRPLSF